MAKDDDALALIAIAAAAVLGAAVIAALLAQSGPEQRQNPEYIRQQILG